MDKIYNISRKRTISNNIRIIITVVLVLIFGMLGFHEVFHGYMSNVCGINGFFMVLYIIAFSLVFITVIILAIRDIRQGYMGLQAMTVMSALGSLYYSIYKINLKYGTYEMLKGSVELKALIEKKGTYDVMLEGFTKVVDDETKDELIESFSLEHLREIAKRNIKNYGGDFLKKTINGKKWVNISFILDETDKDEAVLAFREVDVEKQRQIRHIRLLEEALTMADSSEKAQRQFYSRMSHEMRTPMNIILGMNDIAMDKECSDDKRLYYQSKIKETGNELLVLINNMLEQTGHSLDEAHRASERFDIVAELHKIVEPFRKQCFLENKKLETYVDVDSKIVKGDEFCFDIILNNLLSNAIQFAENGASIRVELKQITTDKSRYTITVEDTGIGMNKDFLVKIFEPYAQENRFGNQSATGGGLGMTYVKSLVSQNGGYIDVESSKGEGTKVIVTLIYQNEATDKNNEALSAKTDWMSNMHMLVVDDNDLNREILCSLLSERNVRISEAVNGKDAVLLYEKSEMYDIDVIIMDLNMPVMDGCEAARAIRALDRGDAKNVFIIALTANDYSEDVTRTLKSGMDAHLSKPININVLHDTILKLYLKNKRNI